MLTALYALLPLLPAADPLGPGQTERTLTMGEMTRSYLVHVPKKYDPKKPMPLVLAYHGMGMTASIMAWYSGLSTKADEAGFIVVYPNGTPDGTGLPSWNSGGLGLALAKGKVDDVEFTRKLLADLESVLNIDRKRVYATGLSNGAMMCHRLGVELSERIAAIAPVAGTLAQADCAPKRPVPVIAFHGTKDTLVPYEGAKPNVAVLMPLKSVDATMAAWAKADGCPAEPKTSELPVKVENDTKVKCKVWGPGKDDSEVVLYQIENGGHTWPGRNLTLPSFIGKTSLDISANDLIWEFFQKHPLK
jgi:polyhydroxybutyrate depolymerase